MEWSDEPAEFSKGVAIRFAHGVDSGREIKCFLELSWVFGGPEGNSKKFPN